MHRWMIHKPHGRYTPGGAARTWETSGRECTQATWLRQREVGDVRSVEAETNAALMTP